MNVFTVARYISVWMLNNHIWNIVDSMDFLLLPDLRYDPCVKTSEATTYIWQNKQRTDRKVNV